MIKLDALWFHNLWNDSSVFDFPPGSTSQKDTNEVIKEAIRRILPHVIDELGDERRLIYRNKEHKEEITKGILDKLGL